MDDEEQPIAWQIFNPGDRPAESLPRDESGTYRCHYCETWVTRNGSVHIEVSGEDASEVSQVARDVLQAKVKRRYERSIRSPWVSGTFYLSVVVVVLALCLIIGKILSPWALPVVLAGGLLLTTVVGAFQLRQDRNLSQKSFVQLMGKVLKRLPVLFAKRTGHSEDDANR